MKKTPDQSRDRRLKILGKDEIEALYGLPRFTPEEQNLYFSLSPSEALAMVAFGSFKTRLYFILQLGYFKAQHQFYVFSTGEVQDDARYVEERYFPLIKFSASFRLSKNTRLDQQDKILELCQYRLSDQGIKQQLVIKARESAKIFSKPIYIFRELIHYLTDQRYVAPGYTFMQDTIGQALDFEEQRLIQIVQHYLTESDRQNLARLVAPSDERYEVTHLKRAPKDFSLTEIAREIERGETMKALYISAERVLPLLEISNESIKYYAQLVDYFDKVTFNIQGVF